MKLDNNQVLCHSTIGYKSDSKPYSLSADTKAFENKEKPLDSTGLNAEGIIKENQNGVTHDIKGNNGYSDPSVCLDNTRNGWPASKLDHSMSVNDSEKGIGKEVRDCVKSNPHYSEKVDLFQNSDFCLDKTVMECELPELVVCYKESTYHDVKDICIDEGVPTQDKFLFDSGVDEKSNCIFLPSEKDQDSKLMNEKLDIDISVQDVSVSPEENQSGKDSEKDADTCMQYVSLSPEEDESNKGIPNECVRNECDSKDVLLTREMKDGAMEMITNDASKELFTLGELLSMPELNTVGTEAMSSDCKNEGIEQQFFQNSSKREVTVREISAVEETNNSSREISAVEESNNSSWEANLSAAALVCVAEESDSGKREATLTSPVQATDSEESTSFSLVNEVSCDRKPENGNITFDFDCSALTKNINECHQNLDCEPLETGSTPKLEEKADHTLSNNLQCGNGESSFSVSEYGTTPKLEDTADRPFSNTLQCVNGESSFSVSDRGTTPKLEDPADQPFSSNLQCGNGESSFSASGPVTGLISYSGPIAFSGSLSLRSDSSTTSTRSFAFPILQSEWNSSPVRMAKADRRHYRKHRGWRLGLLCCRF